MVPVWKTAPGGVAALGESMVVDRQRARRARAPDVVALAPARKGIGSGPAGSSEPPCGWHRDIPAGRGGWMN